MTRNTRTAAYIPWRTVEARRIARIALPFLRDLQEADREYAEDCAEWRKQGYRPARCIHGTNLWVDYDNICGPCEDGYTNHQIALQLAHSYDRHVQAFAKAHDVLADLGVKLTRPQVARAALALDLKYGSSRAREAAQVALRVIDDRERQLAELQASLARTVSE